MSDGIEKNLNLHILKPRMKRRCNSVWLLGALVVLLMGGCNDDRNTLTTGYGNVRFDFSIDSVLADVAGADAIAVPVPAQDEFSFSAVGEENGYVKHWTDIGNFSLRDRKIPVGNYVFSVRTADPDSASYGRQPVYGCEERAHISDSEETVVSLEAVVLNTVVTARFSDEVRSRFSCERLRVKSESGRYVEIATDGNEVAYVAPGTISAEFTLADGTGRSVTIQPVEMTGTQAGEHYEIRAELEDAADGRPVLQFVYDDASLAVPITVEAGDELFATEPPSFVTTGYTSGETVTLLESTFPGEPAVCTVNVPGGLKKLGMTVVSPTFAEESLWSRETDLVGIDADSLVCAGLLVTGNTEGSVRVTVDFSHFISLLRAGTQESATHYIILQAQDMAGRVAAAPMQLIVVTTPVRLLLALPQAVGPDATEAVLPIRYNGGAFNKNVEIQAMVDGTEEWAIVEPREVKHVEDDLYEVTVPIPEGDVNTDFRASYSGGVRYSNIVTLQRILPEYTVTCEAANVWSSKADLIFTTTEPEKVVPYVSVYVKEEGGQWHPAVTERVPEENRVTVSTLVPSTTYSVVVRSGMAEPQYLDFVTEEALEIPNGSFEHLVEGIISIPEIRCGGKYSNLSSWFPIYNMTSIYVDEAESWASVNAKTCSTAFAETMNTWFLVPTTEIVDNASDGSKALRIRNAAWDIHGVEPPRDTRTDDVYFSRNVPVLANRSAGKIFLGAYTFNADGTEVYTEGVSFTSRPTSLTGTYSYVQDIHDKNETGYVRIEVLSGPEGHEAIIGRGEGVLTPSTSYRTFTVPIDYQIRDRQATSLRVMISSSNYASYSQQEESVRIKTTDYVEQGISTGAELLLDNLRLLYE